jgi:CubicO group peptidase (beta-lactamase class C family)
MSMYRYPFIILLIMVHHSLCTFPTSFGGCPKAPSIKNITLDKTNLPSSIQIKLKEAEDMINLIVNNGISLVDSGLWTTPTSAVSVGLVYNQELIWSRGFGSKNISKPSSDPNNMVDEHTIYRIGSISKIFTMLSMMRARDDGILSLDDSIHKHVPSFSVKPVPGATSSLESITFQSLATHMAGITRETPCDDQPCRMNDEEAWKRISETRQILPSYSMPIYSNLGFEILGHATKIATKSKTYESMIDRTIIVPLNLTRTGVNITTGVMENNDNLKHLAWPYVEGISGSGISSNDVHGGIGRGGKGRGGKGRGGKGRGGKGRGGKGRGGKGFGGLGTRHKNSWKRKKMKNDFNADVPSPCGSFCLEDFGWSQPSGSM